ncbi:hypothetical protein [Chondromyces apiculatus]|uniref:hypothetical protein n=1 Tax=Chondromyces apiculatus TaxID=51 RepID=UPI0012DDE179|nr:hypothetical protein [Chondromyces apiculatus]
MSVTRTCVSNSDPSSWTWALRGPSSAWTIEGVPPMHAIVGGIYYTGRRYA